MRNWLVVALLLLWGAPASAAVVGKEVTYQDTDAKVLKGYLAYDDQIEGKRPGVLVVHEWWGHNAYARKRAEMLAQEGYVAFAVDMYGDGKQANHPEDAQKFVGEVMAKWDILKARFDAGLEFLKAQELVDVANLAAIGYCFGGSTVLNMARAGVDLKGVVSFHGGLALAEAPKAGTVKAKVLVCHGKEDNFITSEQIAQFKQEMDAAKSDYRFVEYAGAKHSFTNPEADQLGKKFGMGVAYNAAADQQSWADMKAFLQDVFQR